MMNDPAAAPNSVHILVVEADASRAKPLVAALTEAGYRVAWRMDALAGLLAVEELCPVLVVLDWQLPFVSGATFVHVLRTGLARPPLVIALDRSGHLAAAMVAGVTTVLPPSADLATIVAAVRALL